MSRTLSIAALILLAALALGAAANFFQLQDLRGLVRPAIDEPISLEVSDMSKITRSKIINGENIELVCCQVEGETFRDFLERCNEEWELLCAALEE